MRHLAASAAGAGRRPLRHAVVLGGSVAGLLAARVLSDRFQHVTVIERDGLAHRPEPRKGVPQGNHLHAFLARGQKIADALLPGLSEELLAGGAIRLNAGRDLAWHCGGGWRARYDGELSFLSMSRPLLESRIAERVCARPNVTLLDGGRVLGLCREGDGVGGVRLARPAGSARTDVIDADLVVDAMGRGSLAAQWLAELGFAAPPAELVGARVTYATCTFRRLDDRTDWRAMIVTGKPDRRSGLLFPIEGGRWLATLPGFFDEPTPRDHDAFLAYARSLAAPGVYETIRNCEPLSAIKRHGFSGSLRRRYERLERLPEGLIALGDAVCSFNPVYGQGMTVGAIEAETLGRALAAAAAEGGLGPDFGRRWFAAIAPAIDAAWNAVTLEDLRFPELAGQCPLRLRPMQWYMERVQRATHRSAYATDLFYRVMNFLEPPTALFRLRMIAEALRPALGGGPHPRTGRQGAPAERPSLGGAH